MDYEREDHRAKLINAIKEAGDIASKFISPGFDGMPDRIVLLPGGRMGFDEVKAPGKVPRPLKEARHRMMRMLGFRVYVLDQLEQIIHILEDVENGSTTDEYCSSGERRYARR